MIRPKVNEQEIERKLRSAKAPHPPSHLLDRLKADIPDQVTLSSAHPERRPLRLWRNTWAVAASVLALVGMSYVMLRTMENAKVQESASMAARSIEPAVFEKNDMRQPASTKVGAPQPEPTAALRQIAATEGVAPQSVSSYGERDDAPARAGSNEPERSEGFALADSSKDELQKRASQAGGAEGGIVGGTPGGVVDSKAMAESAPREQEVVAQAPAVAAPPPAAPPKPEAAPRPADAVDATAASALGTANARLYRQKEAKTAGGGQFIDASADPTSTFGLRVGDQSWPAIRASLNGGRIPDRGAVREEEVINHFDYGDEQSRSDVSLNAEAAPAAFGESGLYVLRVALRTDIPLRAAAVQLEFNPEIVRAYRLVGYQTAEGGGESVTRVDLPRGAAVSAVYELRLERRPSPQQRLGMLRLKWEGREASLQIDGSDVAASWNASLASLRLASLAAKWAEMLKGSPFAASISPRDLMTRVQQLSGELAGDAEVAEFVGLVARSVRLME